MKVLCHMKRQFEFIDVFFVFFSLSPPALSANSAEEDEDFDFSAYSPPGPFFDKEFSRNVTALVGKTASLTCRVRNAANRTVSPTRSDPPLSRSLQINFIFGKARKHACLLPNFLPSESCPSQIPTRRAEMSLLF